MSVIGSLTKEQADIVTEAKAYGLRFHCRRGKSVDYAIATLQSRLVQARENKALDCLARAGELDGRVGSVYPQRGSNPKGRKYAETLAGMREPDERTETKPDPPGGEVNTYTPHFDQTHSKRLLASDSVATVSDAEPFEPTENDLPTKDDITASAPTVHRRARALVWDEESLMRLGRLHATYDEIAMLFGVPKDNVWTRLEREPLLFKAYERGRAEGCMSLRRSQIKSALGFERLLPSGTKYYFRPDPSMQIWLGKQLLGQQDRSFLETRWAGKLEMIPDEEFRGLLVESLRVLGMKTIPAEVIEAVSSLKELPSKRETLVAESVREGVTVGNGRDDKQGD